MTSEAAEDQGWGSQPRHRRKNPRGGIEVPTEQDKVVGKAGIAAARAAIAQARLERVADGGEHGDGTVTDAGV